MARTPREKLATIRSTQGWRQAYKAANLPDAGSDDTKRRRLSRLINKKTSGFKKLTPTQSKRINRSYGQRRKKIGNIRAEQAIKRLNKIKAEERKVIRRNKVLTEAQKARRLRQKAPLQEAQEQALRDASQDEDWDSFRAEYNSVVATFDVSNLPPKIAEVYRQQQKKLEDFA